MRSLSPEQVELIKAAANEGLSLFPAGALEKDVHLTEVLLALSQVETADLDLVFCGGTGLVKAFGYLNRMSEDIDIKAVDRSVGGISATRRKMNHLKTAVAQAFVDSGFVVSSIQARSANRHMVFNLLYEPKFPSEVSLRPEIKVEVTYAPVHLPVERRVIRTLLYRDLDMAEKSLDFACIAMEETLAEKVLAFLRRYGRLSSSQELDERLVRHIHDVHILTRMGPDLVAMRDAFELAVGEDAKKFANSDSAFSQDSRRVLQEALQLARLDSKLRGSYSKFVADLVAGDVPDFDTAHESFIVAASLLIESLKPA